MKVFMSSIQSIADKLNLNKSTVSLALNHRPGRMSVETRRRILAAAEEMGYVPNQHAQQLATGRSRTVLVPFRCDDIFDDPFLAEVGKGIQRVLREHGYSVLFDSPPHSGGGDELEVVRRVRSRAFAGSILIEGYWFTETMLRQVAEETIRAWSPITTMRSICRMSGPSSCVRSREFSRQRACCTASDTAGSPLSISTV
jgi:DNA-binding LacI/PurR family transcriptional regulator